MQEKSFYESKADENRHFNFHLARDNFMPAHYHANNEVAFVKKGRVKIIINGREKILFAGEIAVCNRFDVHCYSGDKDSEIYILVFGEIFSLGSQEKRFQLDNFLPVNEMTSAVFELLDLFCSCFMDADEVMKFGFVSFVMGTLYRHFPKIPVPKNGQSSHFVEILTFIDENYASDLSLDSIAARFGYTKNHFSMLFNKFTGMHLRDYMNRLRVEKVEKIRKETGEPVGRIAMSCGFNSLNTYYRALANIKNNRNF